MKWPDPIPFTATLKDVRVLAKAPAQDWEEHLRGREEAAYERGRRDGEHALTEQLLQQRNEMVDLQRGVVASMQQILPQMIQQAESALIDLALESAQKLVAGMPVSVEMVEAVVREAISQAEESAQIVVQLNPDDLALLRKHNSPLFASPSEGGTLRFVASSEISRGGCVAQTRFGIIDAQRETKLEHLRQTIA